MQAVTKVLVFFLCLSPFPSGGLCQDENVVVQLPELGHIKGRTVKTIGNQGHPQKTYYNFRNIPFAQSVSGPHRFSVSIRPSPNIPFPLEKLFLMKGNEQETG